MKLSSEDKSQEALSVRSSKAIWHPFTQMKSAKLPIAITSGKGALIIDENGKSYIDAISSWWVNLHGHAHPYIAARVSAQLAELEHVIFAGFTHRPAVELAEALLRVLPSNQERIFFSDNGSTAVEVALKMAIQYWHNRGEDRRRFVAFKHGYHGDTVGAMSVAERGEFTKPFSSLLFEVDFIEAPTPGNEAKAIEELSQILGRTRYAAFIFEPLVQGAGGMLMHSPHALEQLLALCHERHVLTIADEVMTGFGRTGKMFAVQHLSAKPDIICLSKGITGGTMALGATSCTNGIFEAFLYDDKRKMFHHGHSYTGNPLACTAALASLELLREDSCLQQILLISESHKAFAEILRARADVANVRSSGTILALDVVTEEKNSYYSHVRDYIYEFAISKGVLLRPLGNVIYVLPPYCTSESQLQSVYDVILEGLDVLALS